MGQQVFLKRGAVYSQTEGNFQVSPMLDDGIYQIQQNPMNGELFLVRIADEFHFGFKLYGIDELQSKLEVYQNNRILGTCDFYLEQTIFYHYPLAYMLICLVIGFKIYKQKKKK